MKNVWFLTQELPRASYFNWAINMRNASLGWKKEFGTADSLTVFYDNTIELHFHQQQWRKLGERVWQKVLKDPKWLQKINKDTTRRAELFFRFLKKFNVINFSKLSDRQLAKLLTKFENHRRELHLVGVIGTIIEFDHQLMTRYLQAYIEKQISLTKSKRGAAEVFAALTIFHKGTFVRQEEKSMLHLVKLANKNPQLRAFLIKSSNKVIIEKLPKRFPKFNRQFGAHFEGYRWLQYQYIGPAMERDAVVEVLRSLLKQKIDSEEKLESFQKERKKNIARQRELVKELKINHYHSQFFVLAQELGYIKALRNDSFCYGYYMSENLLKEFGRRLGLSLSQVRVFLPGEAQTVLLKRKYSVDNINERARFSVYAIVNHKEQLLIGAKARKLVERIKRLEPKIEQVNELKGTIAVPGKVRGKVKIVNTIDDMVKMKKADILLSSATYPSLVPAIRKAAAIVTDLGGMTSHAAIISRELGIPCLIRTKVATKVFKDGDKVEVDANKGLIRKI